MEVDNLYISLQKVSKFAQNRLNLSKIQHKKIMDEGPGRQRLKNVEKVEQAGQPFAENQLYIGMHIDVL